MKKGVAQYLLFAIIFIAGCNSFSFHRIKQVAITTSDGIDTSQVLFLKNQIESRYNVHVVFLPSFTMPQQAFYFPRNRFMAGILLDYLSNHKANGVDYVLGITDKDISTSTDKYADFGIIGLAHMPGNSCIVSIFRLGKNIPPNLFKERLTKVCLHELGHDFGLSHCPNAGCFMNDAKGKIATIDAESDSLCGDCKRKISGFIKQD